MPAKTAKAEVPVVQRGNRVKRFSRYRTVTLIAMVLLVPATMKAQTRSAAVTLKGTVSETVALSILPNATVNKVKENVVNSGSTVVMTLSGSDTEPAFIRVPLLVRSNSGFRISTLVESKKALPIQMSVVDVRSTGALVSPGAISELDVAQQFDLRGLNEKASLATGSSPLGVSRPMLVLSGPRISLGGTLDSPNNALQITLFVRLRPQSGKGWVVHLTFVGTVENVF